MSLRKASVFAVLALAGVGMAGCDTIGGIFRKSNNDKRIEGERVSIVAADQDLTPDQQLATAPVELPAPIGNAEWPQPGDTPANKIEHLQAQGPLRTLWAVNIGKGTDDDSVLTASPIVAGGAVFTLDAEGRASAHDAGSGARLWQKDLAPEGEDEPERGFGGGVAYDNGKLYAGTGFGNVQALDAKTGAVLWTHAAGAPVRSAPVVADGRVYAITQENRLRVIDAADGHLLWENQGIVESAGIATSNNVAISGDTVIVPYSSGEIFALRVDNGVPYWMDQLTRTGNVTALTVINDIAGRPVIDRDMVFAVSHSGTLVAINLRTGGRIWTRNVASIQSPLPAGDFLFLVSTEGHVMCLNRADGRVKWATNLPAFGDPDDREDPIVWAGPLLVNNRLLLLSSDGRAVSLIPTTGAVVNQIAIPSGTFIPPVMANGTMYLLTNRAQLVALR
jgi:outer membrane protein assembly factor BamB